jgi:singapore isolate B (sub-type 7) whole genome shotgun sequence assembly, scaffold_1
MEYGSMYDDVEDDSSLVHNDNYATSFVDETFITQGLNIDTVEEYFRSSPFFQDGEGIHIEVSEVDHEKSFFVITKYWDHKREREKMQTDPVAVYYLIGGVIYQCPDLYTLLKYRLVLFRELEVMCSITVFSH